MALTKKGKRELLKSNEFGIEQLTKIQIWKANLIEEIHSLIMRQKKKREKNPNARVSAWAVVLFLDDAIKLASIMSKYEQIGKEFQDLTKEENDELNKVFRDELDLDDDVAEEVAERTNALTLHVADYIEFIATMK